jgi:hypothetical protein
MKWMPLIFISFGLFAAEPVEEKAYLRFQEKEAEGALEVGVISLQHRKTGAKVDLVGAVHIGDKAYYEQLNKQFKGYDSVLYEMVKPADLDPAQFKGRPKSSVSMMQTFMQKQLDLAYQLDEVDYTAKNFVHADMTVKQFRKQQQARGESMFMLMFKLMREDMAARSKKGKRAADISTAELLRALLSPTRSVELKYLLARQFNEMERLTAGLNGKEGSVILTDRNKVALKVLGKEMTAGKRNLAIFYGAAHLPDMEERMIKEMGFERKRTRWLKAWDLPKRQPLPKPQSPPAVAEPKQ